MRKSLCVLLLISAFAAKSQQVEIVTIDELQRKVTSSTASLTIFNFWATWCKPCILEIPHFQELDNSNEDIQVYLVSVDFPNELDRVKAFVKKKSLSSSVLFLNEKDPDEYMPKISKDWTGAIPATLFVNSMGKTYFHEKAFSREELFEAAEKYMK